MGKKRGISLAEQLQIVSLLGKGRTTLEIAKELQRDHRTIKVFVHDGKKERKVPVRSHTRKVSIRDIRRLKVAMAKQPNSTSKAIFDEAGAPQVCRSTRCKTLNQIGKVRSPLKQPLITKIHMKKRVEWAEANVKTDFSKVIFTDECRATLDGPDGWSSGWVLNGRQPKVRVKRQQGGGGVMFWAGIVGNVLIGPHKVKEGVKINAGAYCELLDEAFIPWLEKQSHGLRKSLIFQQDNAPAHKARYTMTWLNVKGFKEKKIMVWPPNSPDLNPIENMWAMIKLKVYEHGRQFLGTSDLWKSIQDAAASIEPSQIEKLTKSVDIRLLKIIRSNGRYVSK